MAHFHALVALGPEAVPAFLSMLTDDREWLQTLTAWGLGWIGPPAEPALPALTAAFGEDEFRRRLRGRRRRRHRPTRGGSLNPDLPRPRDG